VQLSNLSIGRRLGLAFGIVVVAMIVLTGIGVMRVQEINSGLSVINDQNSVKQRYAINFRGSVHDRAISVRDVVLAKTPAEAAPEVDNIARLAAKYADSAAKMNALFATPPRPAPPRSPPWPTSSASRRRRCRRSPRWSSCARPARPPRRWTC
jgi:methyl-accepting chemotaxis protein